MLDSTRNIKLVSRTTIVPVASELVCQSCGETSQFKGVCRHCAVLLVDLGLSDLPEEFPRLIEAASDEVLQDPPLRYNHYEICRTPEGRSWELGRGSMGITYRAIDTHLGSLVALKIIAPSRLANTTVTERFRREARSAAQLRHPNLASIHHLGLDEAGCFYAMEYIEGETLEKRVQRAGKLSIEVALSVVLQTTRALCVAHRNGFLHRDIKPSNLMLMASEHEGISEMPTVKVIDFGLVKMLVEDDAPDGVCQAYFAGTPFYASPEQLGLKALDQRSDIFSLGMCLWFMLVGSVPVDDAACSNGGQRPRVKVPLMKELSGKIPGPVFSLLTSMISPDPVQRPQTSLELLGRVETCLANHHPRSSTTRYRQALALAGYAVGILGLALLGGWRARSFSMNQSASTRPTTPLVHAPSPAAKLLCAEGNEWSSRLTKEGNQRAIEKYSKALLLDPAFGDAHAALASAYLQDYCRYSAPESQLEAALNSAQHAIALDPHSPSGLTALARIHTIQGKHWVALAEYRRALEFDAGSVPAMCGFSQLWSVVGQPQRGLPWAKGAAEIEPGQINNWGAAADASVDLCDDAQAEGFYRRCLEINPAWMSAHCGLMHIHLLQGNFAQARRDCALAESIDTKLLLPLTLKAQIALFSGEFAEAENLYRQLLVLRREGLVHYYSSISYLSALGFLRLRAGDHAEAEAFLAEAAALHLNDSEGPQAIYDLAAIRSVQGRSSDALSLLGQAIASGWMDYRATQMDPRFENLRREPAFRQMADELRAHVERMRKESLMLCSKPLSIADYPVSPTGK